MSQENDAMKAAIDDVNAVAKELNELRQKILQYGEATKRLDKVCESLTRLSEGVTTIQNGVESVVQRAESTCQQMEASRSAVEAMTSTIPDVVTRIESSDVTKNVTEFSEILSEIRALITSQQGTFLGFQSVVDQFSGVSTDVRSIKETAGQHGQLLQLINQVLMQNVAGPVTESSRLLRNR